MKFGDDGVEECRWPKTFLFPEEPNNDFFYFPSTAGSRCS